MLNETVDTISKIVLPSMAILVSGFVTIFVTFISIKYNAKNIYVQANQQKIGESIEKLAEKARRGQIEEIQKFLNSAESIYIPNDLKRKIRKEIMKEIGKDENPSFCEDAKQKSIMLSTSKKEEFTELHERVLNIISEYISP